MKRYAALTFILDAFVSGVGESAALCSRAKAPTGEFDCCAITFSTTQAAVGKRCRRMTTKRCSTGRFYMSMSGVSFVWKMREVGGFQASLLRAMTNFSMLLHDA